MSQSDWKSATNNNPNIIVTLVPRTDEASRAWADSHNAPFYIPPKSQASDTAPRTVAVGPKGATKRPPDTSDPKTVNPCKPALQVTFSSQPKNPGTGFLLGNDREVCDIFLGSKDDKISERMFVITFNKYNDVVLKSLSDAKIVVSYDEQEEERKNFTWILVEEQKRILVSVTRAIQFTIEVPKHDIDKEAYYSNCRKFRELANSASRALNLRDPSSQPGTALASGRTTSEATKIRPFYLRTAKLGEGTYGSVHSARSMPSGKTVAVKVFESRSALAVEAKILKKICKAPHENIVQFIGLQLGIEPFLVMGLAQGGTLEGQHKLIPFNIQEVALITRQMLDALKFLHQDYSIAHRDVKPANILCDNRGHFRLADFGVAKYVKKGHDLKNRAGTNLYMAPEIFDDKGYTAAVDVWSLGLVITWLVSNYPRGYRGDEGYKWCAAVVAHFREYQKRKSKMPGYESDAGSWHRYLNSLVGERMLQIDPDNRESASGCLEWGDLLWRLLRDSRDKNNNTPPQESGFQKGELGSEGARVTEIEENDSFGNDDTSGDDDSEVDTEKPKAKTIGSDEWLELEQQFPVGEMVEADSEVLRHLNKSKKTPEGSVNPDPKEKSDSDEDSGSDEDSDSDEHTDSDEHPGRQSLQSNEEENTFDKGTQRSDAASPAAATEVGEASAKRKRSAPSASETEKSRAKKVFKAQSDRTESSESEEE